MKNILKIRDIKFIELNFWYLLYILNINIFKIFSFFVELTEIRVIVWLGGYFSLCSFIVLSLGVFCGFIWIVGRGYIGCSIVDFGKFGFFGVRSVVLDLLVIVKKKKKLKEVYIGFI